MYKRRGIVLRSLPWAAAMLCIVFLAACGPDTEVVDTDDELIDDDVGIVEEDVIVEDVTPEPSDAIGTMSEGVDVAEPDEAIGVIGEETGEAGEEFDAEDGTAAAETAPGGGPGESPGGAAAGGNAGGGDDALEVGDPMPAPDETAEGGGEKAGNAQQGAVEVTLTEFAIEMPETLPAGSTTFNVTNNGGVLHNFEVEGQGIEQELENPLEAGQSGSLTVDLEPGTYRVYCPVADHASKGMELELTVEEQGGQ